MARAAGTAGGPRKGREETVRGTLGSAGGAGKGQCGGGVTVAGGTAQVSLWILSGGGTVEKRLRGRGGARLKP